VQRLVAAPDRKPHETNYRSLPTKPLNGCHETLLKQIQNQMLPTTKGALMLISILDLVYREFLKSALPGIARQGVWR
jgi:hypothetical protein